ncbi:Endoplasmic reticulum metallopeptidase 1 [Geodia barretti]|uniref:Endoplasmic reticulum metallopeptidase 1 n=1 Tax=Geodia barretti TaxID=519541 RepID=A0AA35RG96_GEOBA|nr:Endoplasmic reticulum metallopeptidase 1 [Geodia barretti]
MSARQRAVLTNAGSGRRVQKTSDDSQNKSSVARSSTRAPTPSILPNHLVILFLVSLAALAGLALRLHWSLPQPIQTADGNPNAFNSRDARRHLEDIVGLGTRHVGSEANEVHAVALLRKKVEEIRRLASRQVEIELSVQQVSGSFGLDFPDSMTQLYRNVTNVAVRFSKRGSSPRHAVLVNAHYDSAVGSPAASDDAVSCGTMLEILRALASDPQPFLADHSIVFLFNGAEETVLQASHGFITQHPWANEVRVFLNLEAAGAGGKEIVFQTGPGHPWLARMYASVVPHPFASVIAQEVFQSGAIPSDTDFRIFRDFGGVPGIDMAYFVNGYVYHTAYDTADRIPDGSIQRAGENVMSMVKALALSPLLEDPGADRHGKVVFFDVFGLFSVVYPERLAVIFNSLVLVGCAVSLCSGISLKPQQLEKPSLGMVVKAVLVTLGSWLAALAVNVATSLLLDWTGHSMTWFSHPSLLLPLYIIPALLGMAEVHSFWLKTTPTLKSHLCEPSSKHAQTLVSGATLALLTYLRVCSAFIFAVTLLFLLTFRRLLWDGVLRRAVPLSSPHHRLAFVLCETLSVSLPLMLGLILASSLVDFLVPMFGRSGSVLPPDLAIAVILALLVCLTLSSIVPFVVYTASKRLRMLLAGCLALLYLTSLALSLSGAAFPYSGGEQPAPKRLFLQHFQRQFLDRDGSVRQEDSNVLLITADYLDIGPVMSAVPQLGEALKPWPCSGVFCGVPSYLPLMKYLDQFWYLPAPPIDQPPEVSLELISLTKTTSERKNFTFHMKRSFPF